MNSQFFANRIQEKRKKAQSQSDKPLDLKIKTKRSNHSPKQSPRSKGSPSSPSRMSRNSPGLKHLLDSSTGRVSDSSPTRAKKGSPFKNPNSLSIDLVGSAVTASFLNASPNSQNQMNKLQLAFNSQMKFKIEQKIKQVQKPQNRKLKISSDDPFTNIFINDMQYEKKGDKALKEKQQKEQQKEREEREKAIQEMDSQNTQRQNTKENEESEAESSIGEKEDPSAWQNEQFYSLPENVQNAINNAKIKKKHSDFYYRLRLLNDKIHVFTTIFYNRVPTYQKKFYEKKKQDLELKLKRQKEEFEEQMNILEKKMNKRTTTQLNVFDPKYSRQQTSLNAQNQNSDVSHRAKSNWNLIQKKALLKKRAQSSNFVLNIPKRNFTLDPQRAVGEKENDSLSNYSPSNSPSSVKKNRTINKSPDGLSDSQNPTIQQQALFRKSATISKVEAIVEGDQKEEHSSIDSLSKDASPLILVKEFSGPCGPQVHKFNSRQGKNQTRSVSKNSSQTNSRPSVSQRQSQLEKNNSARSSTNKSKFKSNPTSNEISKTSIIKEQTTEQTKTIQSSHKQTRTKLHNTFDNRAQSPLLKNEESLQQESKMLQEAINEINYGVAELRDIRMRITQKTEDAISNMEIMPSQNNSQGHSKPSKQFNTIDQPIQPEGQSPTFPNTKEPEKKREQLKIKKKIKKLANSNNFESPYNPPPQLLTHKQQEDIEKIKNDSIHKKARQKPTPKQSFAIKDMASGLFIQNVSKDKKLEGNSEFEIEQNSLMLKMQMNSRPQYPSPNKEVEELQLKVEQTSVATMANEVKDECEDGAQITMRNLIKNKKESETARDQSQIKNQGSSNFKIEEEILPPATKQENGNVTLKVRKQVSNERATSRANDQNVKPIIKNNSRNFAMVDLVGSRMPQQPLSDMDVKCKGQRYDESQASQACIDDNNSIKILEIPVSTKRNGKLSPHATGRETKPQETSSTHHNLMSTTNDLNTQEISNSGRLMEKGKHLSSMTQTGKSNKRQELKDNLFKDNKFIQVKHSQRDKNKNMWNYFEETDENNSAEESGARSQDRRMENSTAPITQTLPTTQNGRRCKKLKSRQIKNNGNNNAYLYQIESQIRSLNQQLSNNRTKAYFKNTKKVNKNSPRSANKQLTQLPIISQSRAQSSLIKAENQHQQRGPSNLSVAIQFNHQVDEIDQIQNLNETQSDFKIRQGLQISNPNDMRLPKTTMNKNTKDIIVDKQNPQIFQTEQSIHVVKSPRGRNSSYRVKNQTQILLDKFNQINSLVNKRNDPQLLKSLQSGSILSHHRKGSPRFQPQVQFFNKRKLGSRQKKEISKTPNYNYGQNSNIQTLFIQESATKSASRNQRAVVPQAASNDNANDTSYDFQGTLNSTMPPPNQSDLQKNDNDISNYQSVIEDSNLNETILKSKRQNKQSPRYSYCSGSVVDESIMNGSSPLNLNNRPSTQLKQARKNLKSQDQGQKLRESQKLSERFNQTNLVNEMTEIKEMQVMEQINQRNVKSMSKQRYKQPLDKIQQLKKQQQSNQEKRSIQTKNFNSTTLSNEYQMHQFNKFDHKSPRASQSRQKIKMIDFVGPLGTHIRPSKQVRQILTSPLNLNQRRLLNSSSQTQQSPNPEKTAITEFQMERRKKAGDEYNIYDVFKQQQVLLKPITSSKQQRGKFFQIPMTKNPNPKDKVSKRISQTSYQNNNLENQHLDLSQVTIFQENAKHSGNDEIAQIEANLTEITPKMKSRVTNTALLEGQNN